jgi:two-component sensor histidine kinase
MIVSPSTSSIRLPHQVAIEGPDVRIPPKSALSLGMGFHELATNAAKYGALSVPHGKIEVKWTQLSAANGGGIRLTWRERNGPPVFPPRQRGFESRLIEHALTYELNAKSDLDYAIDGLRFEIAIPQEVLQGSEAS